MSLVGNLEDLGLGDIFQILFLSRRSGILRIRGEAAKGDLYFKEGLIISAVIDGPMKELYAIFSEKGIASKEEMQAVLSHSDQCINSISLLGKSLNIDESIMLDALRDELQNRVLRLFISEGSFEFELHEIDGDLDLIKGDPYGIVIEPGVNPQFIAMEGSRLLDEANRPQEEAALDGEEAEDVDSIEPVVDTKSVKEADDNEYDFEDIKMELGMRESGTQKVTSTPGLKLLKGMIYELQNPKSSSEITLMLLRFASELMNRAVLFIVKKGRVEGLGQFGVVIEDEDANKRIRGVKIPSDEISVMKDVIESKTVFKGPVQDLPYNRYLVEQLGGGWPEEVFMAPLMVGSRVAAILYGDNLPELEPIGDTEALEVFLFQAGMMLEKALHERRSGA